MNKDELRELLNQEYKTENWKKLTDFVFPNVSYFQKPQIIPVKDKFRRIAESFKILGFIRLIDGKNLAIFEVKVLDTINLTRSRVQLRELVTEHINQDSNHGVLAIYEQGKEEYRFTFTAKSTEFDEEENDFVDLETDAKRFTYILGKKESCKTAANRFWELSTHKDTATIKDVEKAFSVERLNKEFFNKYKAFYEDFVQYITGKRFVKENGKWVEKKIDIANPIHKEVFDSDDKLARNFVKLLMGRLVFIQFLQKKGWMGVLASSKQWKNGDPDFLLNLYNNAKTKDEFHSKCLYPLFYKAFNTPNRPKDVFVLTGNRVPYLNGGLFENENQRTKDIDFPATYFANLLDFFGQYNFTIDENDPLDHEVGIDPEMLGHIFENLLEDNKDKGAFYTPKPIVQYMCQESLIQYLKTYLQEHQLWPYDEEAANQTETYLQNFVRKKIAGELLNDYDEHLAKALKEVKICDPAIGSGAFPMGLLNEIFYCMQVLYDASPDTVGAVWEMEEWAPDIVKKNIIQHSIYGVDIEKGAVDIARLRFWLSLIVDEQEPTPLPNLDFKIMQGNSLLESYEGIDLSKIAGTKTVVTEAACDLFGNPVNAQASIFDTRYIDDSNISGLIDDYFSTQLPDEKQRLKKEIDQIIHKHIDYNLEFEENKLLISIAGLKKNLSFLRSDKNHSIAVVAKTKKANEKITRELEQEQVQLEHLKATRKKLHDLQKTAERPYFLWRLYFKDVFENGGFDIVIGNPPYIQLQKMGKETDILQEAGFETFARTGDIYCLFYEKGIDLLKKNEGVLSYITSNTWMRTKFGESLRDYFTSKCNPAILLNFEDTQIFPSATVEVNILIAKRESWNKKLEAVAVKGDYKVGTSINEYLNRNGILLSDLSKESWVILSKSDYEIKNKIAETGTQLKDWKIEFNRGFLTSLNDAFFISEEQRNSFIQRDTKNSEIIKPLLRGREIKKYGYSFNDNYVLFPHNGTKEKARIQVERDYPTIYEHLLKFRDKNSELVKPNNKGEIQTLIERSDQGDHWTNLRNCAYIDSFEGEKLVWLSISDKPAFAFDNKGMHVTAPAYIMTSHCNKYLMTVLNSKTMEWYLDKVSSSTGVGTNQWSKIFVEQLPIPELEETERNPYEKIAEYLIYLNDPKQESVLEKVSNEAVSQVFEDLVNMMVYELYFEEEMKAKGIDVLQFVTEKAFPDITKAEDKKAIIQKVYYELQQKDNAIRNRILVASSRSETIKRINAATS